MAEKSSPLQRLRLGWLQIVACFAEVQTLALLGLIYVLVIGPAAMISRAVGSDFLSKREIGGAGSAWRDADTRPPELENVKQPY